MVMTSPKVDKIKFDTKIVYNPMMSKMNPIMRVTTEFFSNFTKLAPIAMVLRAFIIIQEPMANLMMNSIVPEKKIKMTPKTTIVAL